MSDQIRELTPWQFLDQLCQVDSENVCMITVVVAYVHDSFIRAADFALKEKLDPATLRCPFLFMGEEARTSVANNIAKTFRAAAEWSREFPDLASFEAALRGASEGQYDSIFGNLRGGQCAIGADFVNLVLSCLATLVQQEIRLENGEWPRPLGLVQRTAGSLH